MTLFRRFRRAARNIEIARSSLQIRLTYRFDNDRFSPIRQGRRSGWQGFCGAATELGTLLALLSVIITPALALYWGLRDALRLPDLVGARGMSTVQPASMWDVSRCAALLMSVSIAALWHEAGHYLTAIFSRISVSEIGLVLYGIFPGAFVAVDPESFAAAEYTSKIKVVLAGIWHNILLCMVVGFFLYTTAGQRVSNVVVGGLGAVDMSERGVVVYSVNSRSALSSLIAAGTLITHIDDVELHDNDNFDHWATYLLHRPTSSDEYDNMGWCLPSSEFEELNQACCEDDLGPSAGAAKREICFERTDIQAGIPSQQGCLDPSSMLDNSRCLHACNAEGAVCIRARAKEKLIRLRVVHGRHNDGETTVSFQGDKAQVSSDLSVGKWSAPWWLPYWLLLFIRDFSSMLWDVSASLAYINALPLPYLDGAELLSLLLTPSEDHGSASKLPNPASSSVYAERPGEIDGITNRILRILRNTRLVDALRGRRWALPALQVALATALIVSSFSSWTMR